MPLSRYQIRSEYSLANPDLYRAADKDDPEGLLEGVAMAGLVGIIRQLGDLAEFAAEVFHDLHEDVLAMAARGHELLVRVQQLETEVPLIEKMVLTKIDHGKCMYNPGLEWHIRIYNDQNHFTQGDLPRFVRSAYEDCRSPPRLFPLDRFDVAGAGSCLKRFTDPSFFKMEWASSELMKAEKEQRDQKARRMKRKGQRQAYGEARKAKLASSIPFRELTQVEKIETSRAPSSDSDWSLESRQGAVDSPTQEDMLLAAGLPVSDQEGLESVILAEQDFRVKECSLDFKMEHSTLNTARHRDVSALKGSRIDLGKQEAITDDSASDTDNFMDAVTTMDSELDTESEMKARNEEDGEFLVDLEEVEAPELPSQPTFEHRKGSDEELDVTKEDKECSIIHDEKDILVIEEDSGDSTTVETLNTEQAHFVANSPKGFTEEEDSFFVDGSVVATSVPDNKTSTPNSGIGTSFPGLGADTVAKSEGNLIDSTATVVAEEEDTSVLLAVKENGLISISQSNESLCGLEEDAAEGHLQSESHTSSPGLDDGAVLNSELHLQSGSTIVVLETPETLVLDKDSPQSNQHPRSNVPSKALPQTNSDNKDLHQVSESDVPGQDLPQSITPKEHGEMTTRKRWQISKLFTRGFLASDRERDSLQVSESEQSESPRKLSLQSSPSSSIQPMKCVMDLSRTYQTDDEMEDMQVSSASHSSSASTLSSPRPSTLTTTLLNLSLEQKPENSVESSPQSLMNRSMTSGTKMAPLSQVETTGEPLMSPDLENSANSSPHSSSSAAQPFFDPISSSALNIDTSSTESLAQADSAQNIATNSLEINPPPPPLPPLAWRMARRMHSAVVNSLNLSNIPTSIPLPCDVRVSPSDLSQASMSSTILPTVPHASSVEPNELTQTFSSPSVGKPTFQKSEVMLEESSMYETGHSDLETWHGMSADPPQVSKPAKIHDTCSPPFTPNSGIVEQSTNSVLELSDFKGEKVVTEGPDIGLREKFLDDSTRIASSHILQTDSIPPRLNESGLELQSKAAVECGTSLLTRNDLPYVHSRDLERKDFSEPTTSHDISRLKKRSKWAWTSSTASSDDREVLLDQIRTRSFSLRNTSREKLATPRPVTSINVAAILEKANAIRQAFAGSDEDDDEEWSDA